MDVVQNEWQQKEWECYKDIKTSEFFEAWYFVLVKWENERGLFFSVLWLVLRPMPDVQERQGSRGERAQVLLSRPLLPYVRHLHAERQGQGEVRNRGTCTVSRFAKDYFHRIPIYFLGRRKERPVVLVLPRFLRQLPDGLGNRGQGGCQLKSDPQSVAEHQNNSRVQIGKWKMGKIRN